MEQMVITFGLTFNEAEANAYGTKSAAAEQISVKAHARKRQSGSVEDVVPYAQASASLKPSESWSIISSYFVQSGHHFQSLHEPAVLLRGQCPDPILRPGPLEAAFSNRLYKSRYLSPSQHSALMRSRFLPHWMALSGFAA